MGGWDASAAQKPRKRSVSIAGHRTSISLEEPFWQGLRLLALEKEVSIAALIAAIDAVRGEASLSSAIRLFVLDHSLQPDRDNKRRSPIARARNTTN
ncbi:MAG: ribbon-helix-helix domain-containing protein [Alphaproteobacteria bacterium]